MRPRDLAVGITLMGTTLTGCSAEVVGSSSPEETVAVNEKTIPELGSISVDSTLSPLEVVVPTLPASTLPDLEYSIEDEMKFLDDLRQEQKEVSNTTIPEVTTTSEHILSWEDEHMLPKEAYITGTKLGELTVTNPDGDVLVNIPLFSNQNISDTGLYSEQLERGAVLEVAHSDINPETISDERGVPTDMGLLGDFGTAVIFGHRMSSINPDWDGDLSTGLEGDSQTVFEKLDLVVAGARAVIRLDSSFGGQELVYEFLGSEEYKNVENENGGFNPSSLLNTRSGLDDSQYLRLLACTPKGSTKDRIAANFVVQQ